MPPRLRKPPKLGNNSVAFQVREHRPPGVTQNISRMFHGFLQRFVPKVLGTKGDPEHRKMTVWFKGGCCFEPKEKYQIPFACYVKDVIRSCQWAEGCSCLKQQICWLVLCQMHHFALICVVSQVKSWKTITVRYQQKGQLSINSHGQHANGSLWVHRPISITWPPITNGWDDWRTEPDSGSSLDCIRNH